jgi:N6-L-threonylcarbamoyladenine synthase
MSLFLGIDTSNYTTSVALYDDVKKEDFSLGKLLPVKEGQLGVRQSDAVFHHTQQFYPLFQELLSKTNGEITAIGVSEKPRPVDGSYMPCFSVGLGYGEVLSKALNVPLYKFTHQHGHIVSALYSSGNLNLLGQKFFSFHISGGTTEALLVDENFKISLVSQTLDLNAGQAVDRVGLMLGLDFPCGKGLEALALNCEDKIKVKPTLKGVNCCLSGLQNLCQNMYLKGESKEKVALFCLKYIEETLYQMCISLKEIYGDLPIVFAGGVMSNFIIRESLTKRLDCVFAKPQYSTDNAVGIAYLAKEKWNYEQYDRSINGIST